MVRHVTLEGGLSLAYKHTQHPSKASVVCFGGFTSEMKGKKASSLFSYCEHHKIDCVVFDYLGHGVSGGDFNKCTLHDWYNSCLHIVAHVKRETFDRPLILVGTSMGGWLMLHVAMSSFAGGIHGLIGLAAAPDFTESLVLSEQEKAEIIETKKATSYVKRMQGVVGLSPRSLSAENVNTSEKHSMHILETGGEVTILKNGKGYDINNRILTSGRDYLVLNRTELPIDCPMVLIHSVNDEVIPYKSSLEIAHKVRTQNVEVILTKNGDHLLNDQQSLGIAYNAIQNFIESVN
ncbi:alpha/beta hydrolase [Anaplasma bovis]|uniref:alpha/beta hydrolase n=1 Tax=Anaplasma bovis TaxID=186733 RepID=UPI002FF21B6F